MDVRLIRAAVVAGTVGTAWLSQGHAATPRAPGTGSLRGVVTCPTLRDCAGAVVYINRIPGQVFPAGPAVTMDQVGLSFVPHVLTIVTGTAVLFPNSDDVLHNVFSASPTKRFNLGIYPKGATKRMVFDTPGVIDLLCNIHPDMSAFIVVADTPFAAIVGSDGRFVLNAVPEGTLEVMAWHEQLTLQRRSVTVTSREAATADFSLR